MAVDHLAWNKYIYEDKKCAFLIYYYVMVKLLLYEKQLSNFN